MNRHVLFKTIIILPLLIFSFAFSQSQTVLPDISAFSQNGVNVLSWVCQYDGIKSIAVQRSSDSAFNYATIGYVKNTKKGTQGFVDGHPMPGKNYYRLYIAFNSDLTWFSNRIKVFIDSAQLMQKGVMPPSDSLQAMIDKLAAGSNALDPSAITSYSYVRSMFVFTNPFTGHINIELPEEVNNTTIYSIKFFNNKGAHVFTIPKISEQTVILDKRNFQKKGLFKFELWKDKEIIETGHVSVY